MSRVNPESGRDETMNDNQVTLSLSGLNQIYNVKNTDGSVHPYIECRPECRPYPVVIP